MTVDYINVSKNDQKSYLSCNFYLEVLIQLIFNDN